MSVYLLINFSVYCPKGNSFIKRSEIVVGKFELSLKGDVVGSGLFDPNLRSGVLFFVVGINA